MTGRGLRGRRQARLLLFAAFALVGFEVMLIVAQPEHSGPLYSGPTLDWLWLVTAVGAAGQVLGIAWMIRIYRAGPEGRRSSFRFARG